MRAMGQFGEALLLFAAVLALLLVMVGVVWIGAHYTAGNRATKEDK
jgi:hypothetical protein